MGKFSVDSCKTHKNLKHHRDFVHFCATILFWILGSSDMSYMVLLEKLIVRKYIWLNLFNVSLRSVGEQPCVRLRGGQCFSPQKIPS